jgi:hypothetical protein
MNKMSFKNWSKEHGFLSGLLFFSIGVLLGLIQILFIGIKSTRAGFYLCLLYGSLLAIIDCFARGGEDGD